MLEPTRKKIVPALICSRISAVLLGKLFLLMKTVRSFPPSCSKAKLEASVFSTVCWDCCMDYCMSQKAWGADGMVWTLWYRLSSILWSTNKEQGCGAAGLTLALGTLRNQQCPFDSASKIFKFGNVQACHCFALWSISGCVRDSHRAQPEQQRGHAGKAGWWHILFL